MTQSSESPPSPDRAWAGRVVFPRTSAELRSTTHCPACLVPLTSTICAACGLDLRHAASVELAQASATAADAMDARLDIIGRIRRETAESAMNSASAPSTSPLPAEVGAAPPPATASLDRSGVAQPTPEVSGQRRSGIQIALIVVGVSLLAVFAIFGLVYAFVTFGAAVRMAIIVGGTLATMVAAGALKRRGLEATGEGIAVLGTVMLVLTAWALRLDEALGLDPFADPLFWGVALIVVAAVSGVWALTGRLSTPHVVAAGLVPFGAALLAGHLVDELLPAFDAAVTAAGIAALATAAVSWRLVPVSHPVTRRAARVVAQTLGAIGATVSLISLATVDDGSRFAPLTAGLVLAVAAALHLVTAASAIGSPKGRRQPLDTLTLAAVGGGAAIAAIAGAVISALRFDQERVIVSAPVIASVLVAVVAEQGWRRAALGSPWRLAFASATITGAAHAAVAGGLAAIVSLSAIGEAATRSLRGLPLSPTARVATAEPTVIAAIAALALCLGAIALSWALLGVLAHRARALTPLMGALVIAAVPLAGPWWIVMALSAVLAVVGAAAVHLVRRAPTLDTRRGLLSLLIPITAGAAFTAFTVGWAVPRGGSIGLVIAVAAIVIARSASRLLSVRAAAVGLGAALVLGSAPGVARELVALGLAGASAASAVLVAAALIIVVSQLGRLAREERWAAGGVALIAVLTSATIIGVSARPGTGIDDRVDDAIALAAVAVTLGVAVARRRRVEGTLALASLPLVASAAVLAAIAPLGLGAALASVAALGALALVAAIGIVVDRDTRSTRAEASTSGRPAPSRLVADTATALITTVVTIAGIATTSRGDHWMVLVAAGVIVLLMAISRDGLVGSLSPRRYLGWLALGLATTGLWSRLLSDGRTDPEPFALPLAGAVLLVVAANVLIARRREDLADRTAAPLTAGALLVALLPSAVATVNVSPTGEVGSDARLIVVAVVAVALTLTPLVRPAPLEATLPGMTAAVAATGVTVVAVVVAAQTLNLVQPGTAAVGLDLVRASLVVAVPSAVAVAAWKLARGRLRVAVTAASAGVAALGAGLLGLTAGVDPVELVSVPLAVALLAIGAVHLDAVSTARSWPWLGPGVGALLVPSLLAVDGAGEPLWRAVALGVSAAVVFLVALRARLQAPFVIAGVVLLVHLLVQSWPLLEQVGRAVEWWLWLGLAGVLVVALAARYERRLQNVRDVAQRIRQLR